MESPTQPLEELTIQIENGGVISIKPIPSEPPSGSISLIENGEEKAIIGYKIQEGQIILTISSNEIKHNAITLVKIFKPQNLDQILTSLNISHSNQASYEIFSKLMKIIHEQLINNVIKSLQIQIIWQDGGEKKLNIKISRLKPRSMPQKLSFLIRSIKSKMFGLFVPLPNKVDYIKNFKQAVEEAGLTLSNLSFK